MTASKSKKNKYGIDMCNGTVLDKLISFSIPLMLSSILQLLFNAVDIVVVGRFSGSRALAAVGSTTALINVFTNLFIGVSLGANVLAARFYATKQEKQMSETVHTAVTFALISGIVMVFVPALTSFVISDLLGGGKVLLIGNVIEQEFMQGTNWHLGSGLSVVLMLFVIASMALMNVLDKDEGGTAVW